MRAVFIILGSVMVVWFSLWAAYNWLPLNLIEIRGGTELGAISVTTIQGSDTLKDSRTTINNNFSVLADAFGNFSSTTANVFSALQQFSAGASTTRFSIFNELWIGGSATSTLQGSASGTSTIQGFLNVSGTNSTSTFSGALAATYLNLTGSSATNTAAWGLNITGGCLARNGSCYPPPSLFTDSNTWTGTNTFNTSTTTFGNDVSFSNANRGIQFGDGTRQTTSGTAAIPKGYNKTGSGNTTLYQHQIPIDANDELIVMVTSVATAYGTNDDYALAYKQGTEAASTTVVSLSSVNNPFSYTYMFTATTTTNISFSFTTTDTTGTNELTMTILHLLR